MSERQEDSSKPAVAGGADPTAPMTASPETASVSPETRSLLSLVDRLGALLEKSDLVEIEVAAGETGIILRKPAALMPSVIAAAPGSPAASESAPATAAAAPAEPLATVKAVKAPLTGVFYGSSSPSTPPFVTVGQKIEVGTVIGLIEAMKLFNEIKSDQAGRVARIVAESGKLVKAKQTLIEVEPA